MKIEKIIKEKENSILNKWIDSAIGTYSQDASRVFKKQKDRFANPIGYNVKKSLERVYRFLCGDIKVEETIEAIEDLIKVRAVQKFSPSEAIAPLLSAKKFIWPVCCAELGEEVLKEWADFEAKLDMIALIAFDFYLKSRERLYQIKVNEVMRGTNKLTDGTKCGGALSKVINGNDAFKN